MGYVLALANEKGGRLVIGMSDKYPHKVVGSDFAVGKVLELEDEIYKRLHIRVHNEELYEGNNRVFVINVPSRPAGKALRFEGVPLMRTSKSLREMDDAEYFAILSEQDPDYSAKTCERLRLEDLDESAISEMRKLVASKSNNKSSLTVPTDQFISDLSLYREGKLTYAALILFARAEILTQYLRIGLGPGFGMHNDTLDHLWGGNFIIYAQARLGLELFRHLRLSVDFSLPYSLGSFPEMFTTLDANIGWVF